jgi:hypothetical protein
VARGKQAGGYTRRLGAWSLGDGWRGPAQVRKRSDKEVGIHIVITGRPRPGTQSHHVPLTAHNFSGAYRLVGDPDKDFLVRKNLGFANTKVVACFASPNILDLAPHGSRPRCRLQLWLRSLTRSSPPGFRVSNGYVPVLLQENFFSPPSNRILNKCPLRPSLCSKPSSRR